MIVNIRGTNGSGKSTVIRQFMALGGVLAVYGLMGLRRPEAYAVTVSGVSRPVFVLGPYDSSPAGSLDSLDLVDQVPLMHKYLPRGHTLFEGSLISSYWGKVGELLDAHLEDVVLAFMPTSLDECLERVASRRTAAGAKGSFNAQRLEQRWYAVEKTRHKVGSRFRSVTLSDDHGAQEILEMFRAAN